VSRACLVCTNAQRGAIETAIRAGAGFRETGRRFDLHKDSLRRHAARHMGQAVVPVSPEPPAQPVPMPAQSQPAPALPAVPAHYGDVLNYWAVRRPLTGVAQLTAFCDGLSEDELTAVIEYAVAIGDLKRASWLLIPTNQLLARLG
jgi:hypothetical protein